MGKKAKSAKALLRKILLHDNPGMNEIDARQAFFEFVERIPNLKDEITAEVLSRMKREIGADKFNEDETERATC